MLVNVAFVPVEVFLEVDEDLAPAFLGVLELLNGQRVQKFVAQNQRRKRPRDRGDRVVPVYVNGRRPTQRHMLLSGHRIGWFGMIERPRMKGCRMGTCSPASISACFAYPDSAPPSECPESCRIQGSGEPLAAGLSSAYHGQAPIPRAASFSAFQNSPIASHTRFRSIHRTPG